MSDHVFSSQSSGRRDFECVRRQNPLWRRNPTTLMNSIQSWLTRNNRKSITQVLLLDCCYSGAFACGLVAKGDKKIGTRERFEGVGRVVLTASGSMQYSFEGDQVDGKGEASVFTNNLVHGLKSGEADLDGDGKITLDELYDYVHERVIDTRPEQIPEKWSLGVQGQIVIARNPNPVIKPVELPNELIGAMENPLPGIRKGAVDELVSLLHGNNRGLALSALEALKRMKSDDSQKVRSEVDRVLKKYDTAQAVKETRATNTTVSPETLKKESATIAEEETEKEANEEKWQGSRVEEGVSKRPSGKKEAITAQTAAKKNKLKWLLPSILIPIIAGITFLVIYINGSNSINKLSANAVKSMLKEKGFFDSRWNKSAPGFTNKYEVKHNGEVVYDRASGLIWQQGGSDKFMTYKDAKAYITQLNKGQLAGYRDWRLPTLEETMSLMEPEKNSDDLYIDSLFDSKQTWIWTSDRYSASSAWVVYFDVGYCANIGDFSYGHYYVRAVR